VTKNVSFLKASRVMPRLGRWSASGDFEGQHRVGTASSLGREAVIGVARSASGHPGSAVLRTAAVRSALVADPKVSLLALTVNTPAAGQRLQTLQSRHVIRWSAVPHGVS